MRWEGPAGSREEVVSSDKGQSAAPAEPDVEERRRLALRCSPPPIPAGWPADKVPMVRAAEARLKGEAAASRGESEF